MTTPRGCLRLVGFLSCRAQRPCTFTDPFNHLIVSLVLFAISGWRCTLMSDECKHSIRGAEDLGTRREG